MSKSTTRKAPTTTALKLVSSDPSNTGATLINNGSVTVYLGESSSVTSSTGEPLYAKCFKKYTGNPGNVYGITASGTGDVSVEVMQGGTSFSGRLDTGGAQNSASSGVLPMSDGQNLVESNVLVFPLTTAITPGTTAVPGAAVAGSLGFTSHATGRGKVFYSDGTTWQLMPVYADEAAQSTEKTVATTGATTFNFIAPFAGVLAGVDFSGKDALATSDTNYVTFTGVNKGQSGSGTNPLILVADSQTTKATGGSAISALTKRSLTLHGTGSNLVVAKGDRVQIIATATGTLANTVTEAMCRAYFTRTV